MGAVNAPFRSPKLITRLSDPGDCAAIQRFTESHPHATVFHRAEWLAAIAQATGHRTHWLLRERDGAIRAALPLTEAHSPLFGRALVSTGFAVGGGLLEATPGEGAALFEAAEELAVRRACSTIELRGVHCLKVPVGITSMTATPVSLVIWRRATRLNCSALRASSALKCGAGWETIWP